MRKFLVFIAVSSLVLAGCKIEDPVEEEKEPVIINPLAYSYAMQDSVFRIIYDTNGVMVTTSYTTVTNYALRLEATSDSTVNIYKYNSGEIFAATIANDTAITIPSQNGVEGTGYISSADSTLFLNYQSDSGMWLHKAMSM